MEQMGNWPVIFLTMASNINEAEPYLTFHKIVKSAFEEHADLLFYLQDLEKRNRNEDRLFARQNLRIFTQIF